MKVQAGTGEAQTSNLLAIEGAADSTCDLPIPTQRELRP